MVVVPPIVMPKPVAASAATVPSAMNMGRKDTGRLRLAVDLNMFGDRRRRQAPKHDFFVTRLNSSTDAGGADINVQYAVKLFS
jgi:hypothetical protein